MFTDRANFGTSRSNQSVRNDATITLPSSWRAPPTPRQRPLGTPGGVLEHGETIEDGLRREVYEETGLKIEPGPLTGVYQNMPRHIVAMVFRCEPVAGELTENTEVTRFRWVTADEVRELATEAYAVRLLDALNWRADTGPAVRSHDGTSLL